MVAVSPDGCPVSLQPITDFSFLPVTLRTVIGQLGGPYSTVRPAKM